MGKVIYILEDDKTIAELITYTLNTAGFKPTSFSTPEAFYAKLIENPPNIILLDIMLSGPEDGFTVIKKLKANHLTKNIPVIFITSKSSEIDKAGGLDIGADDYITKPFGVLELIARVKAVLRRYGSHQEVITYKDLLINTHSKQLFKNDTEIYLTYKEYQLLICLYDNLGITISREILLDKIWGIDFVLQSRTVDVHIRTLRQKLEDNAENPRYIKTIRGYGYMMEKEKNA